MDRKTSADFDQELLNLFDKYVHGDIDRRGFLERATRYAVGGMTAAMLLDALSPRFAEAQQVPEGRQAAQGRAWSTTRRPRARGRCAGTWCGPAAASGKLPGVLVVHENRGLNPHIEDIARRLALEGFMAFAPDALAPARRLSRATRTRRASSSPSSIRRRPRGLRGGRRVAEGAGPTAPARSASSASASAAASPTCWRRACPISRRRCRSTAPSRRPRTWRRSRRRCSSTTPSTTSASTPGWPAYEAALKANHVRYQIFNYPGTQHGFNNDTTPRYDKAAAKLAWQRTSISSRRTSPEPRGRRGRRRLAVQAEDMRRSRRGHGNPCPVEPGKVARRRATPRAGPGLRER